MLAVRRAVMRPALARAKLVRFQEARGLQSPGVPRQRQWRGRPGAPRRCGHCKALKPAYEELAGRMAGKARVAAVDCTENEATCQARPRAAGGALIGVWALAFSARAVARRACSQAPRPVGCRRRAAGDGGLHCRGLHPPCPCRLARHRACRRGAGGVIGFFLDCLLTNSTPLSLLCRSSA